MAICVELSDWVIMAILNYCLSFFMMRNMKLSRSMLHSTHCIYQLLPLLKFMPMKLRTSHCAFALPYCHYNFYKHSLFTMYF